MITSHQIDAFFGALIVTAIASPIVWLFVDQMVDTLFPEHE